MSGPGGGGSDSGVRVGLKLSRGAPIDRRDGTASGVDSLAGEPRDRRARDSVSRQPF